jgi:ABC-2 type transport system permease protein
MPIFFLSGALFPISNLPVLLQKIIIVNPLVYGVDALRGLLTGVYSIGLLYDLIVLLIVIFIMIMIGAWNFTKIET